MVNQVKRLHKRRARRAYRVRNGIRRNSTSQHRLSVFRSNSHIYAQIIDDLAQRTVCAASSSQSGVVEGAGGNVESAKVVGKKIAELALAAGVTAATFDRGSNRYHGRVAALGEAAREAGLKL
jgi:large subunit ribosomal protein L18